MASVLPLQPSVDHTPRERAEIVVADDDEQANVLGKLSSETAQEILDALSAEPGTVSEVADAVETSIQNAQYHLTRLVETDLVEAIDTWYSAKGKEMTVYALAAEELVIQFCPNRQGSS